MRSRSLALALLGLAALAPAAAAHDRGSDVSVNVALQGTTTAAQGDAALATDGNAATTWCPSGSSDTLTIDLGRWRVLDGFGVTLAGSAATAQVTFAPERGRPVSGTVPVGTPAWLSGRAIARRIRVSIDGACVGEARTMGDAGPAIVGHDLSFAVQESRAGATYTDNGSVALPERVLADHGANWVRLRHWIDPPAGYSDLPTVLETARRAKAAGMHILLDPHYSDFWADPQKQPTPAAWAGQDLPTLANTVRTYTRDTLNALRDQGTPAEMLQLGNEIRNGMLWPTGQLDWDAGTGWDNLGVLLRAAAAGARDARGPAPRLVVHFDQGGDNAFSRKFFDNVVAQHVPFDVIGLSYYPFWHGTLSQLRANANDLSQRYDKDVSVVETQYAWTLGWGDNTNNFVWEEAQLIPGYPATPGGQLGFASDLMSIMAAVPHGRGLGVFYWQPEWIPGVGWEPGAGTPNDNLTLFDFTGHALPSVGFSDPLAACAHFAPGAGPCAFLT